MRHCPNQSDQGYSLDLAEDASQGEQGGLDHIRNASVGEPIIRGQAGVTRNPRQPDGQP